MRLILHQTRLHQTRGRVLWFVADVSTFADSIDWHLGVDRREIRMHRSEIKFFVFSVIDTLCDG